MKDRTVQVFLRNPLFRRRHGSADERALTADVVEVTGTVIDECAVGLHVRVALLRDERGSSVEPPFDEIVLPTAKIDYLVVEKD